MSKRKISQLTHRVGKLCLSMSLEDVPHGDGSNWCNDFSIKAAHPKWKLWKRVRRSELHAVRDLIIDLVKCPETIEAWEAIHSLPWPKTKLKCVGFSTFDFASTQVVKRWEKRIQGDHHLATYRSYPYNKFEFPALTVIQSESVCPLIIASGKNTGTG